MKLDPAQPAKSHNINEVPVVCIGTSVGSLEPLRTLFRRIPATTGLAFVVLHHLRQKPTHLPELLRNRTSMPVLLAGDGLPIRKNHIYVLPSGKEITLSDGEFVVRAAQKTRGWSDVITRFLSSLTGSEHPGVAIVLSGLDDDGATALRAFKQHGGITIVQELSSAQQPGMPQAAIRTGAVDYVLRPEQIPAALESIASRFAKSRTATAR